MTSTSWPGTPGVHPARADLEQLAVQLTRRGLRSRLIVPAYEAPYLRLSGPAAGPDRICAQGRRFYLTASQPAADRDDIPLAADIIIWALHAHLRVRP